MDAHKLKILIYHPEVIPPKDYGGVERVVYWLSKGLFEYGVNVTVASRDGSYFASDEINFWKLNKEEFSPYGFVSKNISKLLSSFDLIHFMFPPGEETISLLKNKYLVTVHGNGKPGEVFPENSNFLSKNHANRHGSALFVYNGIDPEEFEYREKKYNQALRNILFLSKTSLKVKNLKGAVSCVLNSKLNLRIAGGNRPFFLRIFCLFRKELRWIGPVSGRKKSIELSQAEALIFPVKWEEPFGLVMVEALMSGTPVLALSTGSVPEIINEPGLGILFETTEQLKSWILKNEIPNWSSSKCRSVAMEKFHYKVMTSGYIDIYQKIVRGKQ